MFLCHRSLRSVQYIIYQLFTIRKIYIVAIDILCVFSIHNEQMISAGSSGNINILSYLNKTFRAENS